MKWERQVRQCKSLMRQGTENELRLEIHCWPWNLRIWPLFSECCSRKIWRQLTKESSIINLLWEDFFFFMFVDAKGVFILKQAGSSNEASRTFLWLSPCESLLTQWVGMIDSTPPQLLATYTHIFYCSLLFNVMYHATCLQISWRCPWEQTVFIHKPGCHLLHRRHLKLWHNACTSPTLHILVVSGRLFFFVGSETDDGWVLSNKLITKF